MPEEASIQPPLPVPARRSREQVTYVPAPPTATQEVPPWHVLVVMWHRRVFVLACLVVAIAIGMLYLSRATPLYSSSSSLYIQQSTPKIVSDDLASRSTSLNLATQCQLITSTAILSQAVQVPGMLNTASLRGAGNPIGVLKSIVKADSTKDSELITVSVITPYSDDAAVIVNGVVQAYITYEGLQHQSNAVQVASILQKEVDSHERDLKDEQEQMLKLRRENPQLSLQFNKRDAGSGRPTELAQQLATAQFRNDDLHAALKKAEAARSQLARLHQLIDIYQLNNLLLPSNLPQAAADYRAAAMVVDRLDDAHQGPASDRVIQAKAALTRAKEEMDQAADQEAANCLDTIQTASEAAQEQVDQLDAAFKLEQKALIKLSTQEAEYDQWAAAAERSERALDVLNGRLKDIHFTVDVGPMAITVLETAKPSTVPVSPVRSRVLGLSMVGGLIAGLAVAMLVDRLDQRLRSVEEVAGLVHANVLGVIPRVLVRRGASTEEVAREAQLKPRSAVAEAFRTIRTAIYFGGTDRAGRTILVTSPSPGDGKSTSVSNLAIAIAQAGRRVLLIDADCRRPVQHKTFNLGDGLGLTSVLTGQCTLDQALRTTEVERLDVLPCGPLPHNPAELLDSQPLLDLLAEVSGRYDQVLLDSPPINMVSDARVLAASCDASVLVLRAERSTRRGATLAWNVLASVGANRLGVVVNDVARPADGYGYTYYGYGRYGYAPASLNNDQRARSNGTPTIVSSTD